VAGGEETKEEAAEAKEEEGGVEDKHDQYQYRHRRALASVTEELVAALERGRREGEERQKQQKQQVSGYKEVHPHSADSALDPYNVLSCAVL
jgi:hypothetical protein